MQLVTDVPTQNGKNGKKLKNAISSLHINESGQIKALDFTFQMHSTAIIFDMVK